MAAVALLTLCLPQDPEADRVRSLVESLGADSPAERHAAERLLEDAGVAALPELERASGSSDSELALRAARLLRVVPIRVRLTAPVRRAVPDAVDRALSGSPHEWALVLLEAAALQDGRPKNPDLGPGDLAPLAGPALRGARSAEEVRQVLAHLVAWKVRSAAPEIMEAEGHGSAARAAKVAAVRNRVALALEAMDARHAAPEVRRYLASDREEVREQAAVALGRLRDAGSVPALAERLAGDAWAVRLAAAVALGEVGAFAAVPALSRALADPEPAVAHQALLSLERLRARTEASRIAALLSEPREALWDEAMRVLGSLEAKAEWKAVARFLESDSPLLLRRAVVTLEALDAREAVPELERLLGHPSRALRVDAAFALASLGSERGLDVLLAVDLRLIGLNGIRSPGTWKKIRRAALRDPLPGEEETFLEDALRALSLEVEWDVALREEGRSRIARGFFLTPGSCAAWSLEVGVVPRGYGVVLEGDRARIMRADDARRHWKRSFGRATRPGTTVVEK